MVNTQALLEAPKVCKKQTMQNFFFASTSETYGDPLEHPQSESYLVMFQLLVPRSVYDEAKLFGETLTAHFWRQEKLDAGLPEF